MTASNGFPTLTTAGKGLFNGASSTGLIQGQAFPDPATRYALRSGIVSQNETVPMWGGIGVYADISPISTTGPRQSLGQVLGRATSLSGSTALVGSTSTRISGSSVSARASTRRWRWPPEKLRPRSSMTVAMPSSSASRMS